MLNTFYDSYTILNKVYSEGAYLKQAFLTTVIDEKNRQAVTKICYGVLDNDIKLGYFIKQLAPKTPKLAIRTLLKIAAYNIKYLNKAPYAVVNTSVELCNKLGKKGASGFVNAFLRKFATYEFALPKNEIERLSVEYDEPEFAVQLLIKDYGKEQAIRIMNGAKERTCVRFSGSNGEEYLNEKGIIFEKTPFNNVFFAEKFRMDDGFDKGLYTFQQIGSIAVCNVIESGKNLLDCCAAPGGKTVYLSEKFGEVTATDVHTHRVELIRSYITRMKRTNIKTFQSDMSMHNIEFEGKFDAVLCDAPCSSFGVLKDNPDVKLNKTVENIKELTEIQYSILKNVGSYVSSGGALYYSTCSIFKDENDGVVNRFLMENSDFTVAKIDSPLAHVKTEKGLQFFPYLSCGAGFYVAKLLKK